MKRKVLIPEPTDPKLKAARDYMALAHGGKKDLPILSRYCRICERIRKTGEKKLYDDAVKLGADIKAVLDVMDFFRRFIIAIKAGGAMVSKFMNESGKPKKENKTKKGGK